MADQFAWLIEVSGPHYLCVRNLNGKREFFWTRDHDRALRFASEDQADDAMMAIRELKRELFIFPTGEDPKPVEHAWGDGSERSEDGCPRCDSPDPTRHPAVQHEGEVQICPHPFHQKEAKRPCGECHLQPGETCDICGAEVSS